MEKRIQPPIPLDTGSNQADEEEMATADAGLPVTGCGTPSCYRGCYMMAQILTFLTGVSLGDRCHPSWRCLSLILGHPVTHWHEGTKAQVGQILLQGPLQSSPAIRLRLASPDTTSSLCSIPSLAP